MTNQNKRLSDVTKQSTTDRASKLVQAFIPQVAPTPPIAEVQQPETLTETPVVSPVPPESQATTLATPAPKAERVRKQATPTNFNETIMQAFPNDLRCDKPIMLTGAHHQMLRTLSFQHNKPMTEILYNLLEAASLPYQREQQKDV